MTTSSINKNGFNNSDMISNHFNSTLYFFKYFSNIHKGDKLKEKIVDLLCRGILLECFGSTFIPFLLLSAAPKQTNWTIRNVNTNQMKRLNGERKKTL